MFLKEEIIIQISKKFIGFISLFFSIKNVKNFPLIPKFLMMIIFKQ